MSEFTSRNRHPLVPVSTREADAEAVSRLFRHLISEGLDQDDASEPLYEQAERAWNIHPEFEFRQGQVSGTVRRESVTIGLAHGVSVILDVQTEQGNHQVILNGNDSAFKLTPTVRELPQ